jgi:uncharacterized protein YuzE
MKLLTATAFILLATHYSAFADATQNKPITVTKNNNAGFYTSYSTEDNDGWAFINYKVDETGKLLGFDIINQSEFRDSKKSIAKYLNNLEFSPALLDGKKQIASKNFFYRMKWSSRSKKDHSQVSKQFYSQYEEIEQALEQNKLSEAQQLLNKISQHHVKNLIEQSLFFWQKSQLLYKQEDWVNYGDTMQDLFSLSGYLPKPVAVPALQNLIEWFVYDQDYAMARRSLMRLDNLEDVVLDEQTKASYLNIINTPIDQKEPITIDKSLSKGELFFRELVRNKVVVKVVTGKLASAELRCSNKVISLDNDKAVINIDVKNAQRCSVLLEADKQASFSFSQHANVL